MADKKLAWCDYEVVDGPNGRYIQENGEWGGRGGGSAHVLAEDGIKFPPQGKDAVLWLVRDGKPSKGLATRSFNRIGIVAIEVSYEPKEGVRIQAEDPFLRPGDGFVILPIGTRCEPGPIDTEEGRPRPTVYLERR